MSAGTGMTTNSVTIETVQDSHLAEVAHMRSNFLNSKFMCCCVPLGLGETENNLRRKFQKHPEMMKVTGVAILEGKVVGYIQLILEGMPCDLHTPTPGEAYVETLAVDPQTRGMGCGSKLMAWSEEIAKSYGCTFMSLSVISGNRAIRLYERQGYIIQQRSCIEQCIVSLLVCCLMGPVICPAGSPWYFSHFNAIDMQKTLE